MTLINEVKSNIQGVHLYGLARPSLQPQAKNLARIDEEVLQDIAKELRSLDIATTVSYECDLGLMPVCALLRAWVAGAIGSLSSFIVLLISMPFW